MKKIMLLACLATAGCVPIQPIAIHGPDGVPGYAMRCSGAGRTLEACYVKAGELCPKGYQIVENSAAAVAAGFRGSFAMGSKRSLVIECK